MATTPRVLDQVFSTPIKSRGGRPKALRADNTTLKQLRGLGRIQATVRECAAAFGVALMTFERFLDEPGVRDAFEEGKGCGQISLRRKQFRLADNNAGMAIFLGKNYLGQADKADVHVTGKVSLEAWVLEAMPARVQPNRAGLSRCHVKGR